MKKIISIIMCLCVIFSTLAYVNISVSAYYDDDYENYICGNFEYRILDDDNTAEITAYLGKKSEKIDIPSTLDEYTVTSIGYSAFVLGNPSFDLITSITIPDSVTKIDDNAFVLSVNMDASCNRNLTAIKVAINNNYFCDIDGVLYNKNKTKLIRYPAGIKSISYSMPNCVTTISKYAFAGCRFLKNIKVSKNINKIGYAAFLGCNSLKSVNLQSNLKKIDYSTFAFCKSLKKVKLPKELNTICSHAFIGCISLKRITLPKKIKTIGSGAFGGCKKLKSITIPKSVKRIKKYAFGYDDSYQSVPIKEVDDFKLKGYKNSAAQKYANKNGFKFVKIKIK